MKKTIRSHAAAKQTFTITVNEQRDSAGFMNCSATVTDGHGREVVTTARRTDPENAMAEGERKARWFLDGGGVR